jgi:hypothetical protein
MTERLAEAVIERALGDKCEHCGGTDELGLWPTLRAGRISVLCRPCGSNMELVLCRDSSGGADMPSADSISQEGGI